MQKTKEQPLPKTLLRAVLIFLCSYVLFLVLWIQIKGYYGYVVTYTASKLVMFIKNVKIEELTREKDVIQTTFTHLRHDNMLIDIPVKISNFTFNAPLTLALMAAFYPLIRKKRRAYTEAMLILIAVHLLYVFSSEAKQLTEIFVDRKIEKTNFACSFAYEFLWTFTDNMVIRFEPFLIGLYMFIRFKK